MPQGVAMAIKPFSRRQFLASSFITLTTPALLSACAQARRARMDEAPFQILGSDEAADFDAIAARIIPSDEMPGAREAGAIYFMDTVLAEPDREQELDRLRQGLAELRRRSRAEFGISGFAGLNARRQDQLLRAIETTPFFIAIRYLTIAGTFALPAYGGNRDKLGYELIGFEDRHAWAPPFGAYDADYRERGQ